MVLQVVRFKKHNLARLALTLAVSLLLVGNGIAASISSGCRMVTAANPIQNTVSSHGCCCCDKEQKASAASCSGMNTECGADNNDQDAASLPNTAAGTVVAPGLESALVSPPSSSFESERRADLLAYQTVYLFNSRFLC